MSTPFVISSQLNLPAASMPDRTVVIGTRGSALALWQSQHVGKLLETAWPGLEVELQVYSTRGDQLADRPLSEIGGKGLFTEALEAALLDGRIDLAVHSLKDLPTQTPPGLGIAAIPLRADPADVLVSRGDYTLDALPTGAAVGTGSLRRAAQLLAYRPDLRIVPVRGNVDTRIAKALDDDGPFDAIVLARAGLERLGRLEAAAQVLPLSIMLPAPGQGALAIQVLWRQPSIDRVAPIHHAPSGMAVAAERAFLARLEGGCSLPAAALATVDGGWLSLHVRVLSPDGRQCIDLTAAGRAVETEMAETIGRSLAEQALGQGAQSLLGR